MAGLDNTVIYLKLSAEFGGTRFGPFSGLEVRLGADTASNNITIPESFGVARDHARLIRQGDGLLLVPAERTAAVWLWKADARRPMQIQTATAVRGGDAFSLVTPEGPRFIIEIAAAPQPEPSSKLRNQARRRGFTLVGFLNEIERQILTYLYTFSPVQMVASFWHMFKSGAFFQPRYIITAMLMLSGYVGFGASGCAAMRARASSKAMTQQLADCSAQNQTLEDMRKTGVESQTINQLIGTVTGVKNLTGALDKNQELAGMVKEAAIKIAADPSSYTWLIKGEGASRPWGDLRKRIADAKNKFDPETQRVLPFVGAIKSRNQEEWDNLIDIKDEEVCARGPLRLTYRQARNLGMSAVMLDAFHRGDDTITTETPETRMEKLKKTRAAAGEQDDGVTLDNEVATLRQGEQYCVFASGADDRESMSKLLDMLGDQVGRSAKEVPDAESTFGTIARVAKLYAADLPGNVYGRSGAIALIGPNPLAKLEDRSGGKAVLPKTAEVLARAAVLSCVVALDTPADKKEAMKELFGTLPDPISCLVLNYKLTH